MPIDCCNTTVSKHSGNVSILWQKSFFAFAAESRACIVKNLAMTELYWATERAVERDLLGGGKEEVEIHELFHGSVKGRRLSFFGKERKVR
jgi:hypothetical protein